jgi:ATP-binding cassette, subfamily B, heavy metal transporter
MLLYIRVSILPLPILSCCSRTERDVLDALFDLARGRTCVLVAHRLSTAAKCDRIVVLENGQVAEEGSHAELLDKGGRYADLWARQQATAGEEVYDDGDVEKEEKSA